jgi:hypothetical protein
MLGSHVLVYKPTRFLLLQISHASRLHIHEDSFLEEMPFTVRQSYQFIQKVQVLQPQKLRLLTHNQVNPLLYAISNLVLSILIHNFVISTVILAILNLDH